MEMKSNINKLSSLLCYPVRLTYFNRSVWTRGGSKNDLIKGVYNSFIFRRQMTYFNADIKKPIILEKKEDDIWKHIQNMNVRSHPFVFKLVNNNTTTYTTSKLTFEQYTSLLKENRYDNFTIYVVGHLTHNPQEKNNFRFENEKEAFPFSYYDADGKKGLTAFVRYPKALEIPKNIKLEINAPRSTFLQQDIINDRLNKFMKDLDNNKHMTNDNLPKDEVD